MVVDPSSAPLFQALQDYTRKKVIPFHTPGHKLNASAFPALAQVFGSDVFAMDPSDEVECLRCNHQFEAVLEEAESLAADLFGAVATRFLVNGTTSGIQAVSMAMVGKVLIPRFSHQSVYEGLILSGAACAYIPTRFASGWGIPLPPTWEEIAGQLEQDPSIANVVLANPTYYGSTAALQGIATSLRERRVALAVDEAHGGHLDFSSQLPVSAREAGADWSVQSTHKVLGSLTQTSMLHIYNRSLVARTLESASLLATTSPSLVFLAVLDAVRRELAMRGRPMVAAVLEMALWARSALSSVPRVSVLGPPVVNDPFKLVFSLRQAGMSGITVENLLRSEYNIQVELSDTMNVLAVIGLGETWERVKALVEAVSHLAGDKSLRRHTQDTMVDWASAPPLSTAARSLREAFMAEKTDCRLGDAAQRISGGFVTPYPPGVPLLVPGEVVTNDTVEYLRDLLEHGIFIRGFQDERLVVLKE